MTIFHKGQRLTHMSKGDAYLWTKFVDKYGSRYSNFRFDVRVGAKAILDPSSLDWMRRSADALSQKRIDVVMDDSKYTYIVEVRVRANSGVLGDLIVYRRLYLNRFRPPRKIIPILITDEPSADLVVALKELKLQYFIV